jgi:hypothetical protein
MIGAVQTNTNVIQFNVGGVIVPFSRATLTQEQNIGSIFHKATTGEYKEGVPFIDVDYDLFKKFCAPYIRHMILPNVVDFTSKREEREVFAIANSVGLLALGDFIEKEIIHRPYDILIFGEGRNVRSGKTYTLLNVNCTYSCSEVSKKRIQYNGMYLSKDKTLEFYGIGPNAELNVEDFFVPPRDK